MEEWGTIITTITTILPFPTNQRFHGRRGFYGRFYGTYAGSCFVHVCIQINTYAYAHASTSTSTIYIYICITITIIIIERERERDPHVQMPKHFHFRLLVLLVGGASPGISPAPCVTRLAGECGQTRSPRDLGKEPKP